MNTENAKIEISAFIKDGKSVDLRSARVIIDGEGSSTRGIDAMVLLVTTRSVQATLHCSDGTTIVSHNVKILAKPYGNAHHRDQDESGVVA